jgi:hypothetical protein
MAQAPQQAHVGPQSKQWNVTITNLEGRPGPAQLRNPELYRQWRIPGGAQARFEAYRYQPELGSSTADVPDPQDGLLHVQCYFKLKKRIRSQALRTLLGLEPYQYHSDPTRNPPAAWDYCGKEDTRLQGGVVQEHGEKPPAFKVWLSFHYDDDPSFAFLWCHSHGWYTS